jgi:hypothetical protein
MYRIVPPKISPPQLAGAGLILTVFDGRGMARFLMSAFAGCHNAGDVLLRFMTLDDQQALLVIVTAAIAVALMADLANRLWRWHRS